MLRHRTWRRPKWPLVLKLLKYSTFSMLAKLVGKRRLKSGLLDHKKITVGPIINTTTNMFKIISAIILSTISWNTVQ